MDLNLLLYNYYNIFHIHDKSSTPCQEFLMVTKTNKKEQLPSKSSLNASVVLELNYMIFKLVMDYQVAYSEKDFYEPKE